MIFDDVERLNNLEEKIRSSQQTLKDLNSEIERVSGKLKELEARRSEIEEDMDSLEYERTLLIDNIEELKEEERKLSSRIQKTLQIAYEEGREKGYQSVINELRSLRVQKSIVLDVFDRHKELKSLFKKLTGKTIRQYLELC